MLTVGVLGLGAHYQRLYWAQSPSRGLETIREEGNIIKGVHVSKRQSRSRS